MPTLVLRRQNFSIYFNTMKSGLSFLLFLVVALVLIGCKPTIKLFYGIKQPKFETSKSLENYLQKRKIPSDDVVFIKDLNGFININKGNFSVPDALFFNARGEYVAYKKSAEECNANIFGFIEELTTINELESSADITLDIMYDNLVDLNFENIKIEDNKDAYVFITWTAYIGKLNKDKAFAWIDVLKNANHNGLNVQYFLLNYDLQKSWNLTPQQEKELLSQFKI